MNSPPSLDKLPYIALFFITKIFFGYHAVTLTVRTKNKKEVSNDRNGKKYN